MTTRAHTYRFDIDGLRAVAVLLVIGRHIGVPWMSGGFTGVDIFFVISGYLITGLLVREQLESGQIGVAAFYARRVRRLLPALGTVIAVTVLIGFAALLPDEQVALAQSALASLAFAANVYFWSIHQGYFADPSALLPLQHLWTLAVADQRDGSALVGGRARADRLQADAGRASGALGALQTERARDGVSDVAKAR